MSTITAVIITQNEETNLASCIRSIKNIVDEVVVVDSGSWDRTQDICQEEGARFYYKRFTSFSNQKNYGNTLAHSEYILSLDADERLSTELAESIRSIKQNMTYSGYTMNRLSTYAGQQVRSCGWYPDIKLRIWKNGSGVWQGDGIHEKFEFYKEGSTLHLKGDILHRAYDNTHEFLDKIQKYSEIYARDKRFKAPSSGARIFYKSAFTFIRNYFFQGGIWDGYKGLVVAVGNANHTFYKYAKLKEANDRLSSSLIISTYNREDALEKVLQSALRQSEMPDEIIVADDGSGDATRKLIERYREKMPVPLIHCWHKDEGFRLAAIRNRAMAMARSEYILMIDGDIVMHRHFVRSHKRNARLGQVLQGSRVLLNQELTEKYLKGEKTNLRFFDKGIKNRINVIYSPMLSKIVSAYTKNLGRLRGANMSFWKQDLIKINGFNEDFVGWGREDTEFATRLSHANVRYKRLKFTSLGYHLYHQEQPRSSLAKNDRILEQAISDKKFRCKNGIDKYMPA